MLGNAAVAAVLALAAVAVGRVCKSPSVRHAAWLLVLVKLVTPPLLPVPLPVLPALNADAAPAAVRALIAPAPGAAEAPVTDATPGVWARHRPRGAFEWAVVVWAGGTAAWFAWQGRRVLRFRRKVRRTAAAPPEVAEAASRIAALLGIERPPAVKLAAGIGSPMLWGWGRSVVLFPRDLLPRLSPDARDTLLAHELAHFLRRDHWVRVLEFAAAGLYWWHPAVWLARRGIEEAEEECCDAWVVGGLAASPRRYAEALLATVDFEAELRRPRLPPGACAAGHGAKLLRRRLSALIDVDGPSRLRAKAVVFLVALALALVRPVLTAADPAPVEADVPPRAVEPQRRPKPPRTPAARPTAEPRAWATATPANGPTVVARDHEVLLRFADGTSRVLGPGRPLAVAFAPGGARLATVGPGTLVRTWDERGCPVAVAHTAAAARSVAYAPDGNALLVLDAVGTVTVRDPQTLAATGSWYAEGANSLACSPDGQTVAVCFGSWLADDGHVELWSVAERRRLLTVRATTPVGAARFAPDGRTLVVGGWNGTVEWHSLPDGALLARRLLTKDLVANTAFSPDAAALPLDPPPEPPPVPVTIPELPPNRFMPER
jgi:beta-lactamase regulating signal transducer with metallopeptidase domain